MGQDQDRRIQTGQEEAGEVGHLFELLRGLPGRTETEVEVRGRAGEPKRRASLKVDRRRVKIMPPRDRAEGNGTPNRSKVGACARRGRRKNAKTRRNGCSFLHPPPVIDADYSASEKVGWHTKRWPVEEYHESPRKPAAVGWRSDGAEERRAGIKRLSGFVGIVAR